jgi:hypothetical protein
MELPSHINIAEVLAIQCVPSRTGVLASQPRIHCRKRLMRPFAAIS